MIGWIFLITVSSIFVWLLRTLLWGTWTFRHQKIGMSTLGIFWLVSLGVLTARFVLGLGPISHMSDQFPWGVWIGLLQGGVALAAGGYVIAATVHIFNIKQFTPILRPMVLTAFLGYTFVACTLFIEVGRPYRLWHPLVMWQHNSIMFEVAWCVTLYMTVLMIEFSPVIFEHLRMPKMVHALHVAAIPIVIVGVILSTLHQSSMGSMFLIIPQKMHPIWISPLLPIFFLVSSVAVGLCMAIVQSYCSYKIFKRSLDASLLDKLAIAASAILWIYFAIKIIDLFVRHAWTSLSGHPWLGISFFLEEGGGVVLPAILFASRRFRERPRRLFYGSLLAGTGVLLNRINVSWFSMVPYSESHYFPSWMEIHISLFIVTVTVMAFALAVKYLPVFPKTESSH